MTVQPFGESDASEPANSSGDRDFSVIRVIGEEDLQGFTFEGLKRKLGAHSETLSRILARLEEQGILTKTGHGYTVTERGKDLAGTRQLSLHRPGVVILRTLLPPYQSDRMVSGLMGRWFGPLRWLGYSQDENGTTMKWITEDGNVQVDAVFSEEELVIEGRFGDRRDLAQAIAASHQLVGYISRIQVQSSGRVQHLHPGDHIPFEN